MTAIATFTMDVPAAEGFMVLEYGHLHPVKDNVPNVWEPIACHIERRPFPGSARWDHPQDWPAGCRHFRVVTTAVTPPPPASAPSR